MSHLIIKKVDGKYRIYNVYTKSMSGEYADKEHAESVRKEKDEKTDAQMDKGLAQEKKEHPSFAMSMIKRIVADHLDEDDDYYKEEGKEEEKEEENGGGGTGKIEKVMGEFKRGTLHSGSPTGKKVVDRKQAIAIALSEQRRAKKS